MKIKNEIDRIRVRKIDDDFIITRIRLLAKRKKMKRGRNSIFKDPLREKRLSSRSLQWQSIVHLQNL